MMVHNYKSDKHLQTIMLHSGVDYMWAKAIESSGISILLITSESILDGRQYAIIAGFWPQKVLTKKCRDDSCKSKGTKMG